MPRNRLLFLATVLGCAALIYTFSGAMAQGQTLFSSLSSQFAPASQITVTGVIQAKNGDVWTINGKDYTVDPASIHGGPTNIGDRISLVVSTVSSAADLAQGQALMVVASPVPSQTAASHQKLMAVVKLVNATTIQVGDSTFTIPAGFELSQHIKVGDTVVVEFSTAADGTVSIHEIEKVDANPTITGTPMPGQYGEGDEKHHKSGGSGGSMQNSCSHHEDDDDEYYTNPTNTPGGSGGNNSGGACQGSFHQDDEQGGDD